MCCLPVIHSRKIAHPSASSLAPAHMLYLSSSLVHHTPLNLEFLQLWRKPMTFEREVASDLRPTLCIP
jgi:hypothetical protein